MAVVFLLDMLARLDVTGLLVRSGKPVSVRKTGATRAKMLPSNKTRPRKCQVDVLHTNRSFMRPLPLIERQLST